MQQPQQPGRQTDGQTDRLTDRRTNGWTTAFSWGRLADRLSLCRIHYSNTKRFVRSVSGPAALAFGIGPWMHRTPIAGPACRSMYVPRETGFNLSSQVVSRSLTLDPSVSSLAAAAARPDNVDRLGQI